MGIDASLRERWDSLDDFDLGRALDAGHSPFGLTPDGLKDYRAIEIAVALSRIDVSGVDFSYGRTGPTGQLGGGVRFLGCRFCHFTCDKTMSGEFLECDFAAADLSSAVLLGRVGESRFEGAKLVGVRASQVTFERCSFKGASLRKASFYDCRFKSCVFDGSHWVSGSTAGSLFDDCSFSDIRFKRMVTVRTRGLPPELTQG